MTQRVDTEDRRLVRQMGGDHNDADPFGCLGTKSKSLRRKYADNGDVTVEEVECLAACGGAPALQVNYEFHENMTPASAAELVDEYESGKRKARTISGAKVG